MISKLKEKIAGFTKCAGIEAILSEDSVSYNFVLLEKKANVVSIQEREEGCSNLENIQSKISKDVPVVLVLNGRGIMHRKVKEDGEDQELLLQILPNARATDFYIQKYFSGQNGFVSIIRKEIADGCFNNLKEAGLSVVQLGLGPFAVGTILPFFDSIEEKIDTGSYTLQVQNNSLVDFSASSNGVKKDYKLGKEELKNTLLIAYSSALQLFFPAESRIGLNSEITRLHSEEFFARKKFRLAGSAFLIFFFLLALFNYLAYSYYKEENDRLSENTNQYQLMISDVNRLQKKIGEKEYFLKSAGWLSIPRSSFYSDEIAVTVPPSVRLSALKVNPVNEKLSKKEKKQLFQTDTIRLAGSCSNPVVLNPWMKELKSKPWVKGLTTTDYTFDHKKRTGSFELEIWVKNEF